MIEVTIPQYIERYKLSNARKRTFYKQSSYILTPLPLKYQGSQFIFKNGKLFNTETKDFVTKNPEKAGKPRYESISGNSVWAMMHEQQRMKMVDQIKADFRVHFEPHREAFKTLRLPMLVECDLYTLPKYADWDLSNLWVYNKVIEDLIKEDKPENVAHLLKKNPNRIPGMGLIPDDCIFYITKPATPRFIPVTREDDRKMVYRFIADNHPLIMSHLMYNLFPKAPFFLDKVPLTTIVDNSIQFAFIKEGATGNYIVNMDELRITANVGKKKIIAGEVSDALNRLFWDCINLNRGIVMSEMQFMEYESYITKFLLRKGIPVYVRDTAKD